MSSLRHFVPLLAAALLSACPAADEGADRQASRPVAELADAPDPGRLIVLYDDRCHLPDCDPGPRLAKLRHLLPSLKVERCPWSRQDCRRIFEREGLRRLPAYLFPDSAKREAGFKHLAARVLSTPKGAMLMLRQRSGRDPRAELCDNGRDDDADGLVDCADPDCAGSPFCRQEETGRLDLFIRLNSLASAQALASTAALAQSLGPELKIHLHLLLPRSVKSLENSGQIPEQHLLWRCAMLHAGGLERLLGFARCSFEATGEDCLESHVSDEARRALDACRRGAQGRESLKEDIRLAAELGFQQTPLWLINNRHPIRANAPEFIRQPFCRHNSDWAGCEKRLSPRAPWPRPGNLQREHSRP